jgi:hypothetical protein
MSSPDPGDDAQRGLEQRALRNVRGLVDKMETQEGDDSRAQRRLLAWLLVGVLAVAGLIGYALWYSAHRNVGTPIVIEPARPGTAPSR